MAFLPALGWGGTNGGQSCRGQMIPSWCSCPPPAYFPPPGKGGMWGAGPEKICLHLHLHLYLFSSLLIEILSLKASSRAGSSGDFLEEGTRRRKESRGKG